MFQSDYPTVNFFSQINIPTANSLSNGSPVTATQLNTQDTSFGSRISTVIPSIYQADLFHALRPVLSHVHLLWELVLTAEPIVVMAPLPDTCANTVHALLRYIHTLIPSFQQKLLENQCSIKTYLFLQYDFSTSILRRLPSLLHHTRLRLQGVYNEIQSTATGYSWSNEPFLCQNPTTLATRNSNGRNKW